ncbi:Gem-associated protein 4 [Trichoplax sp. H2]|nr:Gem-associated protein 4 [Trichoplax sp. H2]|eukprot:RDD43456.1 Gem-associated protein 4 [Trichoplax sp. H2]
MMHDNNFMQRLAAQLSSRILSSFKSVYYNQSSLELEKKLKDDEISDIAATIANDINSIVDVVWKQEKFIEKHCLERLVHAWICQELFTNQFPCNHAVTVGQANFRVKFPMLPKLDLNLYIAIVKNRRWELFLCESVNVVDESFAKKFLQAVITTFDKRDLINANHFIYKLFLLSLQEWKEITSKQNRLLILSKFPMWIQLVSSLGNDYLFNSNIGHEVVELIMDYCIALINLWIQQDAKQQSINSIPIEERYVAKDILTGLMLSSPAAKDSELKSKGLKVEDLKNISELCRQRQSTSYILHHDRDVVLQNLKSNICYDSPNGKYIYDVRPDRVAIFQQIKIALTFVLSTYEKILHYLSSWTTEDHFSSIKDKLLCVLLFNKWLFHNSTLSLDPKTEEIINNKLDGMPEKPLSETEVVAFIKDQNFINHSPSKEKIEITVMNEASLQSSLNEIEGTSLPSTDSIIWLLNNSSEWINVENSKIRVLKCFLQHGALLASASNFIQLFDIAVKSNALNDYRNIDARTNFESGNQYFKEILFQSYKQLSLFEQTEVQVNVLKTMETNRSAFINNGDWLEAELINLLNRIVVSDTSNEDANRTIFSTMSFLALTSPYIVIYQVLLAAVQQVNKSDPLIEFLFSVSTICRFRSACQRLTTICNAVHECAHQVKSDMQIKCFLHLISVILNDKSWNISILDESIPVTVKSLIHVDKLLQVVVLPYLNLHEHGGVGVITTLKLLNIAINFLDCNDDITWTSPILPILRRLCELLDNVRLIKDPNSAEICTLTANAMGRLTQILKMAMRNETEILKNAVTWLFRSIKHLDWQVGLYMEALYEFTEYHQEIPASIFKICAISNHYFGTFRSLPYDEEPFVGFFQCCMASNSLKDFFTEAASYDVSLSVQNREKKVIHALGLLLPICNGDEFGRIISTLMILLEKRIVVVSSEIMENVTNAKIKQRLTLSTIVRRVFDKVLQFYREEFVSNYCLGYIIKLYVQWMKNLCDVHLDECNRETDQVDQVNIMLQYLFDDVASITILLPECYQELSLSLLLEIIAVTELHSTKLENGNSLEFIYSVVKKMRLHCDHDSNVIKQRVVSALDNINS